MLALWLENQHLRVRDDVPTPEPPPGEALIRVRCAGICNTDLELAKGYYPFTGIPGHEFVGEVEAAPDHASWEGKRVVGEINATCGDCPACRAGRNTHCERRTVLGIMGRDGAFAEYLTLPVENLHEVPAAVPDDVAVFTEPTAAALEIQQQVTIGAGNRVVVIGDGKLGNLVAQTLALTGCHLLVIGRHTDKLDLLRSRGIEVGLAADLPGRAADVAVECTGNPDGFELAGRALRPRGTLVLKSTYRGKASVDLSKIVVDEMTVVGSRCGPFAPALELLAEKRIEVQPLIEDRYPLHHAAQAFEHAARRGAKKILVTVL
jgi:threonine dehydrogenase-like Zn-dependent dehydrogenase